MLPPGLLTHGVPPGACLGSGAPLPAFSVDSDLAQAGELNRLSLILLFNFILFFHLIHEQHLIFFSSASFTSFDMAARLAHIVTGSLLGAWQGFPDKIPFPREEKNKSPRFLLIAFQVLMEFHEE